jgi:hypothetical protein
MKILESDRVHTKQNICIVEMRKFLELFMEFLKILTKN